MRHPEPLPDGRGRLALPIDPDLAPGASSAPRRPGRRRAERTILAVIGVAGAAGALARYGISRLVPTPAGHFPWGTFWINVTGSLVIGFVLVLLAERFPRARLARPLVATGFLGAYTTFSTYMVDADLLVRSHDLATAATYLLASLFAGAAAVVAGMVGARLLVRLDHRLGEQLG